MFKRIKEFLKTEEEEYVTLFACKVCSVVSIKNGFCPICKCHQKWIEIGSNRFGNYVVPPQGEAEKEG